LRRSIGYESISRKVVHMRVYEKLDMDLALKCDSWASTDPPEINWFLATHKGNVYKLDRVGKKE
jgi:hypothetical protein